MLKESSDESIFSEDDCAKNQPTLNVKYFYWRKSSLPIPESRPWFWGSFRKL